MNAFVIGSVIYWTLVMADLVTSERLDDLPGAHEENSAFRDGHGGHSVTKRLLWAALWQGFAIVGFVGQENGLWLGALVWVAVLAWAGWGAARGAFGNLRRMP